MTFVVDASIAGAWLMPDERSAAATPLGRRVLAEGAVAPDLFRHEVRNLLVMAVQRRRMPEDLLWAELARVVTMPIRLMPSGPSASIAQRLPPADGLRRRLPRPGAGPCAASRDPG